MRKRKKLASIIVILTLIVTTVCIYAGSRMFSLQQIIKVEDIRAIQLIMQVHYPDGHDEIPFDKTITNLDDIQRLYEIIDDVDLLKISARGSIEYDPTLVLERISVIFYFNVKGNPDAMHFEVNNYSNTINITSFLTKKSGIYTIPDFDTLVFGSKDKARALLLVLREFIRQQYDVQRMR